MEWKQLRDRILFGVGVTGIVISLAVWVVQNRSPDPTLMLAFTGMAGLPAVLRKDEKGQE